jgi:hypothetical protein
MDLTQEVPDGCQELPTLLYFDNRIHLFRSCYNDRLGRVGTKWEELILNWHRCSY